MQNCRFALIYQNKPTIREQILGLLIRLDNDLGKTAIKHPQFQTTQVWPTPEELNTIPLSYQCELIEFCDGVFTTVKTLIIDVVTEIDKPTMALVKYKKK